MMLAQTDVNLNLEPEVWWFALSPPASRQRAGYSDVQKGHTAYPTG